MSAPQIVTVFIQPKGIRSLVMAPTRVQRFSDEALQAQVDKVLASLPDDTKAAELNVGFDQQGVQVVGVVKLDHGFSILAGVSWDRDGTYGGQVALRRVWK